MRIFFLLLFFQSFLTDQEEQKQINQEDSFIRYQGKHLLHEWEGINSKIKGIAIFNPQTNTLNKIALLANIRDFDSNNSGRDAHALEVLEALQFPEIKFFSDQITTNSEEYTITGSLEFHGIPLEQTIIANKIEDEEKLVLVGEFDLTPSLFGISLPSFLGVKMKDFLKINYRIVIE